MLFGLLYAGGKDLEKANFLFNVMENSASSAVHNHSQKLLAALESLTFIASVAVAEILNSTRRFPSALEDAEFQELFALYATNSNMLREFASHAASSFLFPASEARQYLVREDFLRRLEDCKHLLVKPHELRKKFTEYVWQNQARARLPARPLKRLSKESAEEVKRPSEASSRQSLAFRQSLR